MEKYHAVGANIFVVRDETETERGGMLLPDQSAKKPNTGRIISVGFKIDDPKVEIGKKAIFTKSVGTEIEFDDISITVLRDDQILGVI